MKVSFSDEVKHEIVRIKSVELPELAALIRMNGIIQIVDKKLALKIKIYHGDLARKVFSIIKDKFNLDIQIIIRKDNHFSNHNVYELRLKSQAGLEDFIYKMGFIDENNRLVFRIKEEFVNNQECQRAYLRGAFLGGGSINDPRSEYHLEFRCEHQGFAEDLVKLLERLDIEGHLVQHNNKYIVYLKSYEQIITVLNIIGAHQALLKMENQRVLKGLKNDVNRRVNFETANLDKTIQAAMEQLEDIELIEATRGIDFLSSKLQEIAMLRKTNPYASLKELGEMLSPPLSKSGVNHRLRRIKRIADKISGG